ncbi:hypothetical protein PZ938_04470 [Luteipulveratus sp. YIM 133132]|uniref:hypothetical protein n=1 Tax=Luteipulveratus flavus TaxID=3031728 RepID=UPI0023B1F392|nr:hypothetical protein [Luteipulveratus sp. YIM 133132]MDE9364850.1 hypothetical protein [Luteipulveratus sp. YIM 133132]
MTVSARRRRRLPASALAGAALLTFGLTACGGGDDSGSSYTALATEGPASTSSTLPATAPSTTTATPTPSTTTTTPTITTPPTSTSTTPTPSFDTKLANACISATGKMNAVVRQWNSATKSKDTSDLNTAANAMATTATQLRGIGRRAADTTFASRANNVAGELDDMNKARDDGKSVYTTDYNNAAGALRTYCKTKIGQ